MKKFIEKIISAFAIMMAITMPALNLQLFATQIQTTLLDGDNDDGTTNSLKPEIKEFYNRQLLEDAKPNLVHDQFGQKRSIPKGTGKTIEWRKFSALAPALTPLTEGVTPDGNKLNVTSISAKPDQFGDYIILSDVLQLVSYDPIVIETTKVLGAQAGLTMDKVVRNIMNQGTNVSYASKTVSGTVTEVTQRSDLATDSLMSVELIHEIVRKLKTQNVPKINGNYVAIIHPDVSHDLMRDEEWIDAHKYAAPENLYNGEIGKIAGVRFVESTEAKIWNDNTCPVKTAAVEANESAGTEAADATYYSVYSTLFLGADAYGCVDINGGGLEHIIKQKGSAGVADPLNQRSSVGWKGMQTAVILDQTRMVRAETLSSFSGSTIAN